MAAIRRQINIEASPRAVWNALTTQEGWTSWYADEARVDARVGGRVVLQTEDDDGNTVEESGLFHTFRPTRRIEIAWDSRCTAPTRGSRIELNVARDGSETRLSLVHSGGEITQDEEARAALERNWRIALRALKGYLEG